MYFKKQSIYLSCPESNSSLYSLQIYVALSIDISYTSGLDCNILH